VFQIIKYLFKNDIRFRFGFIAIIIVIFLIVLSFFSAYDARERNVVPKNLPPSLKYYFGTNSIGQDIFWKLTVAIGNSLLLGLVASCISRTIGLTVGLISGYLGGRTDRMLSTISGSFIVIPRLPLLILLSFVFKEKLSFITLGVILGCLDWAWPGRRYRSQILSLREMEFTYTARFSGMNALKVVSKEHLPFLVPYLMADLISGMLWAIAMEITLAVLGLSDLMTPTIGTMVFWAGYYQATLKELWWWISAPILAAVFTIVALYLLSASISQYLDPRTRLQMISVKG